MSTIALLKRDAWARLNALPTLAHAIRSWRWKRAKVMCRRCAECGTKLDASPDELFDAGHFRAAVFMSRIVLEFALSAAVNRAMEGGAKEFKGRRSGRAMIPYLRLHRRLTNEQSNQLNRVYRRASKVIHGGPCDRAWAKRIVADTESAVSLVRNLVA